jgi:hypothetical protein
MLPVGMLAVMMGTVLLSFHVSCGGFFMGVGWMSTMIGIILGRVSRRKKLHLCGLMTIVLIGIGWWLSASNYDPILNLGVSIVVFLVTSRVERIIVTRKDPA